MNFVETIAAGALGWLWQTSLGAAALVCIVLLVQWTFARWLTPRWTYILWMLVAVRLILPLAPQSAVSVSNLYVAAPPATAAVTLLPTEVLRERVEALTPLPTQPGMSSEVIIMSVWMVGAVLYLLACILQYRRLAVWVKHQPAVSDARVLEVAHTAQQTIQCRPVRIVLTHALPVPAIIGVLRPCLLLPRNMVETWSDAELKFVILHELVHLRRRDNLLNWVLIFIQALHWFNPVVWFAFRRLRAEREALCDSIVLSHVSSEDRSSYGTALIKAAQRMEPLRLSPGIVPMLNHKQEIHRRIRMITRFKPTPRLLSICAAALVLVIACVTFTGAAQKSKVTPPAAEQKKDEPVAQDRAREGLKTLEVEWQKIDVQAKQREAELQKMQEELRMPDYVAEGDGKAGSEVEAVRKLEQMRVEAQAEIQRITTLQRAIAGMNPEVRRRSVSVAYEDAQLSVLMNQLAAAEQKLAVLGDEFAPDHPEVKTAKRMIALVGKQVDDRIEGIVEGLKVKVEAHHSRMDFVARELDKLRESEIDKRAKYRPYFQAKRDLESLLAIRERLMLRIIQEKVDLAVSPATSGAVPAKP